MAQKLDPATLAARAARIRLQNKVIAETSGIDQNTVGRILRDIKADIEHASGRQATHVAIGAAIAREELDLLNHLVALHPDAAREILLRRHAA
jgi:hypothetical protein